MSEYWLLVITAVFGAVVGIVTPLQFAISEYRYRAAGMSIAPERPAPRMR